MRFSIPEVIESARQDVLGEVNAESQCFSVSRLSRPVASIASKYTCSIYNCRKYISLLIICLILVSCSSKDEGGPETIVEYYQPAFRTEPTPPIYSRLMWSHQSEPIGQRTAVESSYILPVISFELHQTSLEEAIEALAQTMGYRWHYPKDIAKRSIKINMEGTVEEVLREIGKQANVSAEFDHKNKMVLVRSPNTFPRLPK